MTREQAITALSQMSWEGLSNNESEALTMAIQGLERLTDNDFVSDTRTEWNTTELQEDFIVKGFLAPFVTVTRKKDGVEGTLEFTHNPRKYFNFVED
jgi:hypothetical protein